MTRDSDDHRALRRWIEEIDVRLALGTAGPPFWLKVQAEAPPEAMSYLKLRFDGEVGE